MTMTPPTPPTSPSSSSAGWRFARTGEPDTNSLPEAFASVRVPDASASWLRRFMAFVGPGYMVSVGYMDPGNWATDLQGGAQFGYTLLAVIMLSNLMAIVLQSLSARLGIATGRDLAQACRDHFPPVVNIILWLACELA
ncbi:Nramp family divalent metal transporter, partial [Komagataeibacter intermedius]